MLNITNTMSTSWLTVTTLQVSVRFWPGLWRGAEGFASRDELLLVLRDVEQVDPRHIVEPVEPSLNLPVVDPSSTPLRGSA